MLIEMYMACPVCASEGWWSGQEYWLHMGSCQGRLAIDEFAYIHCKKCEKKQKLQRCDFVVIMIDIHLQFHQQKDLQQQSLMPVK